MDNSGKIKVSLHIDDDIVLEIKKKDDEECFECELSEEEVDWMIDSLQNIRKIQLERKNLGDITFEYIDY
jgi:hypothetical protein